jgi:hypothetical protein
MQILRRNQGDSSMRVLVIAAAAAALTGCVTVQQHPNKRPLTAEAIQTIGKTNVVVARNNEGVEKSWFMTDSSAAGAQYGLIGALVTGVMDAIINAGPSRRAQKAANEIAELAPPEMINASLVEQLRAQMPVPDVLATGVAVGDVSITQKIVAPDVIDGAVELKSTYVLSEDASAFRIVAKAQYNNAKLKYTTPYTFKGSVPKSELSGPVYSNVFTYQSAQLPVPTLSTELQARLIASIEESYKTETGAPAADSQDGKAMAKELENARDDKLTKDEIAIFLTREWIKDNGALLRKEIETAHGFVAKFLVQDLNSPAVPNFAGQDELLETAPDGRTVRRVGAGVDAGSYVSAPGNLTAFTTYGNVTAVAKKHADEINQLRDRARASKKTKK